VCKNVNFIAICEPKAWRPRKLLQVPTAWYKNKNKTTNSVAFILQANYADWATDTGRPILVPTFVDRVVSRRQRGGSPMAVNLSFVDQSR
jgi:hypothetical protein